MCKEKSKCCCPKEKDPKKCTPKEVSECHPEAKDEHPCEAKTDDKPKE